MSGKKSAKKKNSQLVIRINDQERDAFVSLCDDLDTSAAREIRRFIRGFLKENQQDEEQSLQVCCQFLKNYKGNCSMAKVKAKAVKKQIKSRKAKIAKHEGKLKKLKKQLKKAK